MNQEKGVLLHISSLPGDFGIGDLGPSAYEFCDYLAAEGFQYWQILPLNHPGYGNSPYNPISAFALNPYLISPELLLQDGLITPEELEAARLPRSNQVQFESVYIRKDKLLNQAAKRYLTKHDIGKFIQQNSKYLKPYLCFLNLAHIYGDNSWIDWDADHRTYSEALYELLRELYHERMDIIAAQQAIVNDQIQRLRKYMDELGIKLIGDIPLYLSYQSSEVWTHHELFDLQANGKRNSVAGVPPDAFSETGQLWGNPIYRWDRMKDTGFELFMDRIRSVLGYISVLRLDHFIGYVNYWKVDASCDDATKGVWTDAEPEAFFQRLLSEFPGERFIAEDLGILNPKVTGYRDQHGLPGMIILQFCFEESVPIVENYPVNCVIYTGTHDNPTCVEWWNELESDSPSKLNLAQYLKDHPEVCGGEEAGASNISEIMMRIIQKAPCKLAIFTMQDLLGLGDTARMNIPGTALGNWQWRMEYSV